MTKKIKCIMLIDDNSDDNFYHERVIRKSETTETIISEQSAEAALAYLRQEGNSKPEIIFLDINMPGMNGWEFLHNYRMLDKHLQSSAIIVMLTTSENPDDRLKAINFVSDFKTKPLTKEMLEDVIKKYFKSASK
jgi:CheY-like chemotaxis protein